MNLYPPHFSATYSSIFLFLCPSISSVDEIHPFIHPFPVIHYYKGGKLNNLLLLRVSVSSGVSLQLPAGFVWLSAYYRHKHSQSQRAARTAWMTHGRSPQPGQQGQMLYRSIPWIAPSFTHTHVFMHNHKIHMQTQNMNRILHIWWFFSKIHLPSQQQQNQRRSAYLATQSSPDIQQG